MTKEKLTQEQITEQAKEFIKKWFPKDGLEIECPLCTRINCVHNSSYLTCNYTFEKRE